MDAVPTRSDSPRWFWIATLWGGIGLFDATQTVFVMRAEGMHHNWGRLFFTLLISWLPWMLATPFVLRLSQRYPPSQWRHASTWVTHLAACAAIGVVDAAWRALWEELLNPWALTPRPNPFLDADVAEVHEWTSVVCDPLQPDSAGRSHSPIA